MSDRTIFMEALDFEDPDTQFAFNDKACNGNPELRARVEGLLQSHRHAGRFLHEHPAHLISTEAGGLMTEPSVEASVAVIGPYTLRMGQPPQELLTFLEPYLERVRSAFGPEAPKTPNFMLMNAAITDNDEAISEQTTYATLWNDGE